MIRIHTGSSSVYWIKLVGWYLVGTMKEKTATKTSFEGKRDALLCEESLCLQRTMFFGLGYSWQLHLTHVQSTIKFYYVSSQVKSHLHVQQRVVYHRTADLGVIVLVGQICP